MKVCCNENFQAINRLPALLNCLGEADNATIHSSIAEPISELNEDLSKYQQMIETTVDMDAVDRGKIQFLKITGESILTSHKTESSMDSVYHNALIFISKHN